MTVGVDADGVLTDMAGFNYEYGEKFWRKKPVFPEGYKTGEIFGVSHRQEILFGIRYFYDYCMKLPPRENAVKVCRGLAKEGHALYCMTARKYAVHKSPLGQLSRSMFGKWLAKNGLVFRDVFFCSEENTPQEKLEKCREISAGVMIDDKPDVALHLAENGIKVILFDAPYNKDVRHENIIRAADWEETGRIIASLS